MSQTFIELLQMDYNDTESRNPLRISHKLMLFVRKICTQGATVGQINTSYTVYM